MDLMNQDDKLDPSEENWIINDYRQENSDFDINNMPFSTISISFPSIEAPKSTIFSKNKSERITIQEELEEKDELQTIEHKK